jgi:tetraacyldisaccharide 4'-kinase
MRIRERCFHKGIFRSASFNVPVISIGNLTMGGTGKTPMVLYIAGFLKRHGYQPAVISRGYGGATKERINIVSAGKDPLLGADYVGDEPRMLAERLSGVFVLTGVVRKLPAARAVEMGADVLLLDDGFQHLQVRRDLDFVLFNSRTLAGNSRVFPGGDLREPVKALHRCHAFILTGMDRQNRERAEKFIRLLQERFPGKEVFSTYYKATSLIIGHNGRTTELSTLADHRCYAFCGIAEPESFRQTLARTEIDIVGFSGLSDHHAFHDREVRKITALADRVEATCLLCTEKDLVKLRGFDLPLPLFALRMEVESNTDLERYIFTCLTDSES